MNSNYKVGDLIYDANIYDGMNTHIDDLQFYKRWMPQNKDARILELCCGTGRLTIPIAEDGYNISGVDYTFSMLEQAKAKAYEAGLKIEFIEADIITLEIEVAAYTTKDGREILIKQLMRYERKTQINRIEWHYFINGKFDSIQNLDMRLFFPQELDTYLDWNGFKIIHKFGSFEEEAFYDSSEKQIFVCQ